MGVYERRRAPSGRAHAVGLRMDAPTPWDYEAIAREHAAVARSVVDLGTGGGERLASIVAGMGARAVATEEWHVNAPVARLQPLGIDVIRADALRLPFVDLAFDLVLDRHEALDPVEVARVLAPQGTVITQQVGHDHGLELRRLFPRKTTFDDHLNSYQRGFRAAKLVVDEARWHEERVAFATLGDVAFMLLTAPWFISGFDPEAEIDQLLALEDTLGQTMASC
jgi:SAM-dependent methyltransferase